MTQEDKDLLLKDICARLLYGVFVKEEEPSSSEESVIYTYDYHPHITKCKPYLRPMSSMTEEERDGFRVVGGVMSHNFQNDSWVISAFTPEAYDWLNAHHFDYRGLIEKGLAIEVTKNNNPYKE